MSEYIIAHCVEREEIVRCRDCKYMSRDMYPFYYCYRPEHEFAVSPNGYCKWGERRDA